MNRISKTLIITTALAVASTASAQWSAFHGGPERTGYSTSVVPNALTKKWEVDLGGPIVTSPVVGPDGAIYLGPILQDNARPTYDIIALNPDGSLRYRLSTPFEDIEEPTISTPAVDGKGNLYVGTPSGAFMALDPSGNVRWKKQFKSPVIQSPVIGPNGHIYVSAQGSLTSFSPEGTVNWRKPMGNTFSGGPSVAKDGTIYAVMAIDMENPTYLCAFSPDGKKKWQQPIDWWYFPLSTPTIGPYGTVYTVGQRIHAFAPDGTEKWSCEPTYGISNYAAVAVDPAGNLYYSASIQAWKISPAGQILWSYDLTPDQSQNGKTYGSIVVDGAGKIFLPLGDGKRHAIPYEQQMLVLNNGGTLNKSVAFPEIPSGSPAIGADGTLYVGCLDGKLYAFGG